MLDQTTDSFQARFSILDSGNAEEVRDSVCAVLGARRVAINRPQEFRARASYAALNDIELIRGSCSTGIAIEYPELRCYRIMLAPVGQVSVIDGKGEVAIDERQSCVTPPGQTLHVAGHGASSWTTLRVRPEAVTARALAYEPERGGRSIHFGHVALLHDRHVAALNGLVHMLVTELANFEKPNSIIVNGLEDLIVTAFLRLGLSNTPASAADAEDDAPARRAADYIDANWNRHVGLDELVQVANLSARSLHRAFQKRYGCPPVAFAKRRRLGRARELLNGSAEDTTVTEVAFRCGFSNLGHFARDYARLFGELPSKTLARRR